MSENVNMTGGTGLIYRLYNYVNNTDPNEFFVPPFDINYNILGFSKKRTFMKGELQKIDYYGYVDSGGTYQDLILTEYREFFRKDRFVYKRRMHVDWYLSDGTVGSHKETNKYYSIEESLKLGERRRRNVVSDLKIYSIGLIQMISGVTQLEATAIGLAFLADITLDITKYIEGIEDPLKWQALNYNKAGAEWLNAEIPDTGGVLVREYLYDAINIDYSDKLG